MAVIPITGRCALGKQNVDSDTSFADAREGGLQSRARVTGVTEIERQQVLNKHN